MQEKGLTLVPTRIYFKDGRVKVELALARGKETRDKRRDIAEREARREMERELKYRPLPLRRAAARATISFTTYGGDQVSTWSVLRLSCKPRSPVGLVKQPGTT